MNGIEDGLLINTTPPPTKRDASKPNLSFSTTTSFVGQVILKDKEDTALTTYVQEFETPSFSKGYSTKRKGGENVFLKGQMRDKTPVTISFIVDDDWWVYTDLLDIFNGDKELEQINLFLMDGQDRAVVGITYHEPSISNISPIQITTKEEGAVEVFVQVEIIFTKFTYKRIV
jgi:hypothetical protein